MKTVLLALALAAIVASPSLADGPDPAFLKNFFAPDLVLKHAHEIDLTKQQRAELTKDIGRVTGATTELQLAMVDGFASVEQLSAADPVNEKALLDAVHEVLLTEMQVKEAHMGLLVRIRNLLTPEQREKLRKLRADS
jgi:Spy/CpxP family protein refolding chaperone